METENIANHMDEKEKDGLCDETLEKFGQFFKMIEVTSIHPEVDLECSICMDLLHRPHQTEPCRHIFCLSCLIRLNQAGGRNCPLCRTVIQGTNLKKELDEKIQINFEDYYISRMNVEMESGSIFLWIDELQSMNWRTLTVTLR